MARVNWLLYWPWWWSDLLEAVATRRYTVTCKRHSHLHCETQFRSDFAEWKQYLTINLCTIERGLENCKEDQVEVAVSGKIFVKDAIRVRRCLVWWRRHFSQETAFRVNIEESKRFSTTGGTEIALECQIGHEKVTFIPDGQSKKPSVVKQLVGAVNLSLNCHWRTVQQFHWRVELAKERSGQFVRLQ